MTSTGTASAQDPPVAVVTGGGGGIGAAVAEELGRQGWFVVTIDPMVSSDGSEALAPVEETTAERIVAAGGSARASSASVTDADEIRRLFRDLAEERGRLDAVVNVAGISRPTSYTAGLADDWRAVLAVHLDGYRNVLAAALPIMAAAGRGRILGVTSGSGWRQADTGAYGCAKRAVASLTWQLGRAAPPGVVVNAMSPIAVTRMVTEALERARGAAGADRARASSGGLSLGSMPTPAELGPIAAYLVGDALASWCSGAVVFVGGSEVAAVEPPRLLEVVRTDGDAPRGRVLEAFTAGALAAAEAGQTTGGGSNPRFPSIFDAPGSDERPPTDEVPRADVRTCAVVGDRPAVRAAIVAALDARGIRCDALEPGGGGGAFEAPAHLLAGAVARIGPLDAVVMALAGPPAAGEPGWEAILAEHDDLVDRLHVDAGWSRAVADHAISADRPLRLVTFTDAATSGGRSRAQAAAQLARAASRATGERVAALAVSVEAAPDGHTEAIGELAAHLVCSPSAAALSGAELAAGPGWFGLRSHPRPAGSITYGGPQVPEWLDGALREIVR